jgi:hypothetical protein
VKSPITSDPIGGAREMTTMTRRDAWAYGLVVVDIVAVILWVPLMGLDTFALIRPLWLLLPAIFVLLPCVGFRMRARAEPQHRDQRPLVFLKRTSLLMLTPLVFYVGMTTHYFAAVSALVRSAGGGSALCVEPGRLQ